MSDSNTTPSEQGVSNLEFLQGVIREVKDLGLEVEAIHDMVNKPIPLSDVTMTLLDSLYDLSCGAHDVFVALTSNADIISPMKKIAFKAQTFILADTEDFFI